MDIIQYQEIINTLHDDIIRYRKMVDTYTKLIHNVMHDDTIMLSYEEMMRRMDYAERQLSYARKEVVRVENKYYSQFPFTQAQLECVGLPSGITDLDGSDKY